MGGILVRNNQISIHYISPISCGVFGNVAILQYYLFTVEKILPEPIDRASLHHDVDQYRR